MFELFYPDYEVESIDSIDFDALYAAGKRAVIFDIDNTLVPHGAPADPHAIAFFEHLHNLGFQTILLSNNKEPRVKSFGEAIHSDYIFKAGKPGRRGYVKAMEKMRSTPSDTIFVGDQLFTDVWGAKRASIPSYLVHPINPKEEIQIVLKRYPEKLILYFYHKRQQKNSR